MREHPEDRKARLEGEQYGRDHASEFCTDHFAAFVRMIGIYPDDKARAIFEHLRETFWAEEWKPRRKKPEAQRG